MIDFPLAPNFSFYELTNSAKHPTLVAKNRLYVMAAPKADLIPSRLVTLVALAAMLQRVRDGFNRALVVHSGARCPDLNAAVGGRPDSQHLLCQAADFHVDGVPLQEVYDWIVHSDLRYGQCLLEGVTGAPPSWIHLSLGEPWRALDRSREHMQIDATTNRRVSPG